MVVWFGFSKKYIVLQKYKIKDIIHFGTLRYTLVHFGTLWYTLSSILFIECLSLNLVNDLSSMKIGVLIICYDTLVTKLLDFKLIVLCFDSKW